MNYRNLGKWCAAGLRLIGDFAVLQDSRLWLGAMATLVRRTAGGAASRVTALLTPLDLPHHSDRGFSLQFRTAHELHNGRAERPASRRFSRSTSEVVMQTFEIPLCPKCGQTPKKMSERRADLNGGFFNTPEGSPKETIYVFKCQCGTAFSHSVKETKQLKTAG
jgi:hypothetical protein